MYIDDYGYFTGNSMPHGYLSQDFMTFIPILLSIFMAFFAIILVIALISYIFNSIGLYTMAKNKHLDHAWLAWIPIAKNYILGDLINDEVTLGSLHIPYARIFLTLFSTGLAIVSAILSLIPYLGTVLVILLSLAVSFYYYTALYWLFNIYDKKHCVIFLVLSIIFPFMGPIFTFAIRNHPASDERQADVQTIRSEVDAKSIIALSLGVLSIISTFPLMGSGLFTGTLGLIFSIISLKELKETGASHGMALAGLICSISGMVLALIALMACVTCIGVGATGFLSNLIYY